MANLKYGYVPFYNALLNLQLFKGQKAQTSHILVYGLITQYHTFGDNGCFASNEHLAKVLGMTEGSVKKVISQLKAGGWIDTQLDKTSNTRQIVPKKVVEIGSTLPESNQLVTAEYPAGYPGVTTLTVPENKANNKSNNKSIKDIGKPISKKFTDEDVRLVNLLHDLMYRNNEDLGRKEPRNVDFEEMRKMREIDKRDPKFIEGVIYWSQQDSFWWRNIRSVHKLRKQFETLYIQAHGDFQKKAKNRIVEV